jgi:hypothetical protein
MHAALSMILLAAAVPACSKKSGTDEAPPGSGTAAAAGSAAGSAAPAVEVIRSEDEVCDVLTPEEIKAELGIDTVARMLPRAGEYGAPTCAWYVDPPGDADAAPPPRGVSITMFLQDTEADGKEYYDKKLESVCGMLPKDAKRIDVSGVGDHAAVCGRLWVRSGSTYFSMSQAGGGAGTTPEERLEQLKRLALKVIPRVPR